MKPVIPLLALTLCVTACQKDSKGPTADDLRVQDSLLTHDVMTAWGDSFHVVVEEPRYRDSGVVVTPTPKSRITIRPAAPALVQPAPVTAPAPRPISSTRREVIPARIRSIPKGASLSLVTLGRICTSRIGERFPAALVAPVSTKSGMIPSGSRAVAEITSNDQWGAGIGVRIMSIHSDGTVYPVTSRVTYIVPTSSAGSACIPSRAHIDTEVRG